MKIYTLGLCAAALLSPYAFAQSEVQTGSSTRDKELTTVKQKGKFIPGVSIGFRARGFPLDLLEAKASTRSSTGPTQLWLSNSTSDAAKAGIGLSLEFILSRRLVLSAELLHTGVKYESTRAYYLGDDNTATTTDERKLTTHEESTKATWWDLPLMIRYEGIRDHGWLSRTYVSAGGSVRNTRKVSSTTTVTLPDNTTSKDFTPANPGKKTMYGAVVGLGFRLIDDFNIKVTPEVRFTRWNTALFNADSIRSRRNQLEVGIGMTF